MTIYFIQAKTRLNFERSKRLINVHHWQSFKQNSAEQWDQLITPIVLHVSNNITYQSIWQDWNDIESWSWKAFRSIL